MQPSASETNTKIKTTIKDDLNEVRRIVCSGLKDYPVKVYLFGSHAIGKDQRASDIDVAVLPLGALPREILSEIQHDLEEINVLYPVDLIDLTETDTTFRERVLKEGIPWKE